MSETFSGGEVFPKCESNRIYDTFYAQHRHTTFSGPDCSELHPTWPLKKDFFVQCLVLSKGTLLLFSTFLRKIWVPGSQR